MLALAKNFLSLFFRHAVMMLMCILLFGTAFLFIRYISWRYSYEYAENESKSGRLNLNQMRTEEEIELGIPRPSSYLVIDENDEIRVTHDPGFKNPWIYATRKNFSFSNGAQRPGVKSILEGSPYISEMFEKDKHESAWSLFSHLLMIGEYDTHHSAIKSLIRSSKEIVNIDDNSQKHLLSNSLPYFNGILWHIEYYLVGPALEMFNRHEYGRAATFMHRAARILALFDIPTQIESETQWRINKIYLLESMLSEPQNIFANPEEAAVIIQAIVGDLNDKSFRDIEEKVSSKFLDKQKQYLLGVQLFRRGFYDDAYEKFSLSGASRSIYIRELSNLMKIRCLYWLIVVAKEKPTDLGKDGMSEVALENLALTFNEQIIHMRTLINPSHSTLVSNRKAQTKQNRVVSYADFLREMNVLSSNIYSKNFRSDVELYIARASSLLGI